MFLEWCPLGVLEWCPLGVLEWCPLGVLEWCPLGVFEGVHIGCRLCDGQEVFKDGAHYVVPISFKGESPLKLMGTT